MIIIHPIDPDITQELAKEEVAAIEADQQALETIIEQSLYN